MDRTDSRKIKYVEFDASTNWVSNLPYCSWLAIILTKDRNKKYFDEIVRKSIDRNVCFICCIGEQQDLVHDMADEEIAFRCAGIEPLHLPKHMIVTTGHEDLEEGVWFGIFTASNDECEIEDVVIINATNDEINVQNIADLTAEFQQGYIPTND